MTFFQTYAKELVSLLVPFVGWALARFLRAKARLVVGTPHAFVFLVQEPLRDPHGNIVSNTQTARTCSYMVKNAGSETATKVELVFNWKPLCINIWPSRHIEEHVEPDSRYVIILESLAPKEFVGLELLSVNTDLPNLVTARSQQCVARHVEMYPQPLAKPWQIKLAAVLMLAGVAAILYGFLLTLQFLILGTPYGH